MAKPRREFGEGIIVTITNYIFWFFLGNFYFTLLNIPLLFLLLSLITIGIEFPDGMAPVAFFCCIPIGPAATALFSVMGKIVREKDVSITRDFFKAYKVNFFQSLHIWLIEMVVITLLIIDASILASKHYPNILIYGIYFLIALILAVGLYVFPIISRFYLKTKDVIILSLTYTIKKPHITFLNICSFLIVSFIFFKLTTYVIIFMSSLVCFLIMYYERNILIEIQEKLTIEAEV